VTKEAALHQFFNSLGIPGYPVSSVPDGPEDKYLTYDLRTGAFDSGEISITVNLWFYTTSEEEPNAMARKLSETTGNGGKVIRCDGGYIWLKRGSPWCQSLSDGAYKRRYINMTAEFFTAD